MRRYGVHPVVLTFAEGTKMPTQYCDCCGEGHDKKYNRTCDQCCEALGHLSEEVKWMLERIIKNRIEPLERCTCIPMGENVVASDGRCPQHNRRTRG